jgi:basic amino acid/polyamine antiporter, APA family
MNRHKIGFNTAVAIVVANMIGTGVFTSLGFQVMGIESGFSILALWVVGGILALCGALTYGEIGAAFPESGGEYNYLSKLYHPSIGFISGWVSVTVGFAAPIAAAAVALGEYVNKLYPEVNSTMLGLLVIGFITIVHSVNLKAGGLFQRVFTVVKVVCIVMFIGFGLCHVPQHTVDFSANESAWKDIFSSSFAVSLVYVTYAYSGWNAASYISGEIENTKKTLPRALFVGTAMVMIIYTVLNFVFLYSVPIPELKGELEVGYLSANKIFGFQLGQFMSLVIALLLVSTISAMVLAGPRVMQKMGQDIRGLKFFAISNKNSVPYIAIVFQSLIAIVLVLTSSFQSLITYVGFTLNLFTFLTVLGIFILRYKHKHIRTQYRTFLYPLTPLLFLCIIGYILYHIMRDRPVESLYGFGTVIAGLLVYFITNKNTNDEKSTNIDQNTPNGI